MESGKAKLIRIIYANQVDLAEATGQGIHEKEIGSRLLADTEVEGHYVGQMPSAPSPLTEHPRAHFLPISKKRPWGYLAYQFRLLRTLWKLTRRRSRRDTVIFLRYGAAMVAPWLVSWLRRIPMVIRTGPVISNLDYYGKKANHITRGIIKFFWRKHLKRATTVVSVSRPIKDYVVGLLGIDEAKYVVSRNGCNERIFHVMDEPRLPDDLQHLAGKRLICFVGVQEKDIGVMDLIDAIGLVNGQHGYEDVTAVVIGPGSYQSELKQHADSIGLTERIVFTGPRDQGAINQVLNCSHAAVLPWRRFIWQEKGASPMKLFEYIATGVPVVATRDEGSLFVEENDLGVLVEPDSPADMAKKIRQVMDHPSTDRAARLRRRDYALEHGTWQAAYLRLRKLCEATIES